MAEEADITVNKAEMRMGMQVGTLETLYAHSAPHRKALGCLPALLQDMPTRCMSISSDMLAPTRCYSKTGTK